jgi:plasmid stabilization system protein ParE
MAHNYSIEITDTAQNDYRELYLYLANELHVESSAKKLTHLIEEKIKNLAHFPLAFPLCPEPVLRAEEIHKMPVKKYLVFYIINDSEKKVYVLRILHSLRDYENLL